MTQLGLFLFVTSFWTPPVHAKVFQNSYIQFHMPDRWACELKGKAYLCRHKISKACQVNKSTTPCKQEIKKSREAVIVLTAKEKSEIDSIENYKNYLGESRTIQTANGRTSQSQVIHNKVVGISKLKWVDGMHLGSELPHYYTRYLATLKGNVAVLVTFTAHKLFYTRYSTEFFKGIKSLNLTATSLSEIKPSEVGNKILSRPIDIPLDLLSEMNAPQEPAGGGDDLSILLFGLSMAMAGAGIFIWFRSRKRA